MQLLYFTTAYDAGIFGNRIHEEFLARLMEAGFTTGVLTPDAKARGAGQLRTEAGPLPVTRAPVSATRSARFANRLARSSVHYDYFFTARAAYRRYLARTPQPDLVHVESVYPLGAVAALAGSRVPFVPTIRGGDLIADDTIGYGFARFRSVRLLLRLTFARATLVRAVSPGARTMAIQYGCPPEKIVTVARNIRDDCYVQNVPAFRAQRRDLIAARHGVEGKVLIVAAGRLLPVKGFDDLIRALPALIQHIPQAVVLLCGPNRVDPQHGDYGTYLGRLAQELGVAEHVRMVGHVPPDQMVDYLAAADAVAVPSLIEGGNKILVEGAAVGTPFVATETSGTVGFFTTDHGITVPPRAPAQLATALADLLADPARWQARSTACLAAREQFRSRTVSTAMIALYRQALAAAAPISL